MTSDRTKRKIEACKRPKAKHQETRPRKVLTLLLSTNTYLPTYLPIVYSNPEHFDPKRSNVGT